MHVPSDAPAWEKVLVLGSDQANIAHCEADLPKGDFATLFATVKVTFRQVQDHQSDRRTTRGSYDLSDDFCF